VNKPRPTTSAIKAPSGVKPPPTREADWADAPAVARTSGGWVRFWFTPADPVGLHALRVLTGLLLLYWLLPFAGNLESLFSFAGWIDRRAYGELGRAVTQFLGRQPANWSLLYLVGSDPTTLAVVYGLSLAVLALFTLGVCPRLTSVLTWVVVCSFVWNPATQDDTDWLLPILALYLMVGYVLLGQGAPGRSLAWRLLGPAWPFGRRAREEPFWRQESVAANAALRLLQVHFAIVMVTSGLHKLQFGDWWNGLALWAPLHPPLETRLSDVLELRPHAGAYLFVLSLAAYAGLAWQLGFPLFAWRRGLCRLLLLTGAAAGCLSMAFVYGAPVFGPALVVFCLAYLTPAEWHRLLAPLARVPALAGRRPAVASGPVRRGAAAGNSALVTGR
jgi:hypothetical protein